MSGPARDPGLAGERTALAWHRTGLSSLALGALAVHSFQERMTVAVPIAALLAVIGLVAYRTGSTSPVAPARLRAMSLAVGTVAVLCAGATIAG